MSLEHLPVVRVQVESMRASIVSILNDRHQDLLACVSAGIDAAVTELPASLARQAKDISESYMREALEKAMKAYWESGAGRDALDAMIAKKVGNK